MAVRSADWLELMRREYLRRYIPGGGSAIKFAVGEDTDLLDLRGEVECCARDGGLHAVAVDAASVKIHMIQDVFFAAARSLDWERLAQSWVEALFRRKQYSWPRPGFSVPLSEIAAANDVDATLLRKQLQQWLAQDVMRENELAPDFRAAIADLCLRRTEAGDERATAPVIEWLRGELRTIGPVKQVPINAKITRHNGRSMLRSLCHWLRMCGVPGLLVTLDFRQLGRTSRIEGAIYYTPAAIMDAYEVLRQLIDDAEGFRGLFLTVLVDPTFRDESSRRGVAAYRALKERIWPDVHARGHENPLTPMVQIAEGIPQAPLTAEPLEMDFSEERVAVEALRAGVPNRAAIRLLGSADKALCDRFLAKLRESHAGLAVDRAVAGELVAGGFGAGKSHLLWYLAEQALKENFVVSVVPVSKETPLFDPQRMFVAAVRNAIVPGVNSDAMTAVLGRLDPASEAFQELDAWASGEQSGLSAIFAALLFLLPRQVISTDERAAIARFLGGAALPVPKVRQWLRAAGAAKLFNVGATRAGILALHRLRFAPRLFAAAGYAGWCILIDEVELIGRYSTLQRGRSYAELCRWLNLDSSVAVPGLVSVAAITDDYKAQVLELRLDQEKVPALLRAKGLEHHLRLAEIAMLLIEGQATHLSPPDEERLHRSLDRVRHLYAESYGWPAYGGEIGERRAGRTMREYIKAWVTAWDIYRLYGARDEIDTETIASDYSENTDLEHAPADEPADGEPA
jgi:hypothetical protein